MAAAGTRLSEPLNLTHETHVTVRPASLAAVLDNSHYGHGSLSKGTRVVSETVTHTIASLNNSILAGKLRRGNGARRTMIEPTHTRTSPAIALALILYYHPHLLSLAPPCHPLRPPIAPSFFSLSRA